MAKRMRTKADLLNDPRVDEIWQEGRNEMGDGKVWYWLSLADGYIHDMDATHNLHEPTIADLIYQMGHVVVCDGSTGCGCAQNGGDA